MGECSDSTIGELACSGGREPVDENQMRADENQVGKNQTTITNHENQNECAKGIARCAR
jgi:hypothetical protein